MSMISLSIFLCIDESRLELFLSVDCTHFCFVFCVIHSTRFQQAHNRIHAMDIHLRNQQPNDRNVGMECLPYICSSVLFIFDRNEIILMNGCFFQLLSTVQHSNPSSIYKLLLTYSDRYLFMKCQLTFLLFFLSRSRFIYK